VTQFLYYTGYNNEYVAINKNIVNIIKLKLLKIQMGDCVIRKHILLKPFVT